jgi:hypothetical protein
MISEYNYAESVGQLRVKCTGYVLWRAFYSQVGVCWFDSRSKIHTVCVHAKEGGEYFCKNCNMYAKGMQECAVKP